MKGAFAVTCVCCYSKRGEQCTPKCCTAMSFCRWLTQGCPICTTLNEAPQESIALLQLLAFQPGCRECAADKKLKPGILVILLQSIAQSCLLMKCEATLQAPGPCDANFQPQSKAQVSCQLQVNLPSDTAFNPSTQSKCR